MKKILLGEVRSKKSINEDNLVNVNFSSKEHVLPVDNMTQTLDSYKEYLSEKDKSDNYRLIFTINPVCSNILFNAITEIVYKEGSKDCSCITKNGAIPNHSGLITYWNNKMLQDEEKYICEHCGKVYEGDGVNGWECPECGAYNIGGKRMVAPLTRTQALRDTAFSHPDMGGLVYHCGIDIFNNHFLRKREFKVVNKLGDNVQKTFFNTIRDYLRDANGDVIKEKIVKMEGYQLSNREVPIHLYQDDETKTYQESMHDNLGESDGWIGFINPVTMNINNYGDISINKCLNNNKGGEFIDMYPDRSLYSFVPKYNKYRNRLENNWDYFITYPYANDEDNEFVKNGLRCFFNDLSELNGSYITNRDGKTSFLVSFKTEVKNNLYRGSFVRFVFINSTTKLETEELVKVESIGVNGEDTQHVFSVNFDSIVNDITRMETTISGINNIEIRIKKNVKGADCRYYFRKFRRLPNFKNTDVYITEHISENDIRKHTKDGFTNSINPLAFAENIYSDKISQIVFNDDIVTTGLRDNLNRKLSELYLTVVKRNKGHKEWYDSGITKDIEQSGITIEYSHCFGTISSGLDLPTDSGYTKYNVHRLTAENREANAIEPDITDSDDEFYGDLVELSPYALEETVLEEVYHRFNTEQRENMSDEYKDLVYDEFVNDDYDVSGTYKVQEKILGYSSEPNLRININEEGYYYKPHYRVKIRNFDTTIKQGAHTKMTFENLENISETMYSGRTSVPYGISKDDVIYLINPNTAEQVNAIITKAEGDFNMNITFVVSSAIDITKFSIYRPNPIKPDYAYELNDGTARYIWREIMPENKIMYGDELYDSVFTNGAHYFHQNINFYLKRQDPSGEYGLNRINSGFNADVFTGAARGEFKDISMAEVQLEGENDIC